MRRTIRSDRVNLTDEQKQLLKVIYDGPTKEHVVQGDLAAYLALTTICGPATSERYVRFAVDDATMWQAASPELQGVIGRDAKGRLYFSGRAVLTT
ncbi:hypothetical protein [Bradyrhizobium liaoningense]|uniref:hypothetical protein n=1 Tax=Bradyrhizobium liaoningense TaxID=43992 RepID=UPI001BA5CF22|nr:hypothetical protein [Bradyrhizobium liaoningense]MBR0714048.1 hypothetical protein [Bradyrhizobium liaoningense]